MIFVDFSKEIPRGGPESIHQLTVMGYKFVNGQMFFVIFENITLHEKLFITPVSLLILKILVPVLHLTIS